MIMHTTDKVIFHINLLVDFVSMATRITCLPQNASVTAVMVLRGRLRGNFHVAIISLQFLRLNDKRESVMTFVAQELKYVRQCFSTRVPRNLRDTCK